MHEEASRLRRTASAGGQSSSGQPSEFTIRDTVAADLPGIREIYNYYVAHSTVTFDETAPALKEWRTRFSSLGKQGLPFLTAESSDGHIVGFAYVAPWRQKAAYRFTVENSIYLDPAAVGNGLGTTLLAELLRKSQAAGITEVLAVVAEHGAEASIRLHKACGFREVGRLSKVGFKFNRWLDTIVLQKSLI